MYSTDELLCQLLSLRLGVFVIVCTARVEESLLYKRRSYSRMKHKSVSARGKVRANKFRTLTCPWDFLEEDNTSNN